MQPLSTPLRNKLENTVKNARDVAEDAARAAIEQLGVQLKDKPSYLDEEQIQFRKRLRAHARQLGDARDEDGGQAINHLVVETAYEQWHRMLFARFLAENQLLMHPDGVAVSLAECDEMAVDEGAANGWELAGRYAARMLPQIFRPDLLGLQLKLAPEYQKRLEKLLADLDSEVFTTSDSLGWVYQFWQAKKKEEVNKSEVKIGADELPAVTQLFTEPYMVQFLLHNSLGAWWVVNHPDEPCPVELTYLRTMEDGVPAAGSYEGWPKRLAELKLLDPSCGSGHFLVAAFLMLVAMRMQEEGLSAADACNAVLRDNIHGLEIDPRCVEIAAFALAMAAWSYPDAGGYRPLPELHMACSGLSVSVAKEEWKQLALDKHNMRIALDWMYEVFRDAPVLGSLLNPAKTDAAKLVAWEELSQTLEQALSQGSTENSENAEMGIVAQGLAKSATLLGRRYHFVVTNVPYLARGKQCDVLKDFCEKHYPAAKNDLATVFLDRCLELCEESGTASVVMPQNWLFLTSYKRFREKLLTAEKWNFIARLGPGAFETISGEVVKAVLITISKGNLSTKGTKGTKKDGGLFDSLSCGLCGSWIRGVDVSESRTVTEKAAELITAEIKQVEQAKQLENPDARVTLEDEDDFPLLNVYADALVGLQTSDDPMFVAAFWEISKMNKSIWEYLQSTPDAFKEDAGSSWLVRWEEGKGLLLSLPTAYPTKGLKALGKHCIALHRMNVIYPYWYTKERLHQNVAVLIPKDESHLPAIWCFCSSPEYNIAVRRIDQKLNVTNATLVKVPFDLAHWQQIAAERYPNGLPKPYSDDPTQWIFHGHPASATTPLHVATARLLGYRWPAETDKNMELSDEARQWIGRCAALDNFVDDDGIVCIPPVRGEKAASERLHSLLVAAYGDDWSPSVLSKLLADADCAGKTLEFWLRDKFFEQHFKLFHHRPFLWHIWDGVKDGFAALVNYHTLTRQNLETLIYTYLGDWIKRQEDEIKQGTDGATIRLAAAQKLKVELAKILEGEAPYDIFVRWKPLHQQPSGWEPDLNDGVRLNIRPFIQAGILRKNPNINWNKDRGKDVESAPWFHKYGGDRINDCHLTLEEKKPL